MDLKNSDKPTRLCKSSKEIVDIFKNLQENKLPFIMWQNKDGKRYKTEAFIFSIDEIKKTIAVKPSKQEKFQFGDSFEIYIYRDNVSLLFKTNSTLTLNNMIILGFPKEIRIVEKRISPRVNIEKNKIFATIQKTEGYKKQTKNYKFQIIDISLSGIALLVHSHELSLFNVSTEILLTHTNDTDLDQSITATVMYCKKNKTKAAGSNTFKVGIAFKERISQGELTFISKQKPIPKK